MCFLQSAKFHFKYINSVFQDANFSIFSFIVTLYLYKTSFFSLSGISFFHSLFLSIICMTYFLNNL